MPIVETHRLVQGELRPDTKQIYNLLDCCLTIEIFEEVSKLRGAGVHDNLPNPIYDFERALQAPALEMMLRGWAVDGYARKKAESEVQTKLLRLYHILDQLSGAVWDRPPRKASTGALLRLNPRSRNDMLAFFHGIKETPQGDLVDLDEPSFRFTPVWASKKGQRKLSMDREALEKLEEYFHAQPIVATILAIRELEKQLQVIQTEVDYDGRMRTSYNVAGTTTGRWSSSANAFGTGSNLQNIDPSLRYMFVADPGWKICGIDYEQSEARDVGFLLGCLFNDWSYLDACEGGDLHTYTSRLIWPGMPWTGDIRQDRIIAEQLFYRHFTYRDMSKRGGHGTTYLGTAFTMARFLKVPLRLMVDFQAAFLGSGQTQGAFPGIPKWHRWTAEQIQTKSTLTTPFGRKRQFFSRPNDDTTLREAVAYVPQSMTADRTNLALWRIWKYMGNRVQILHQNHDAIYFQYQESDNEPEVIQSAMDLLAIPLTAPNGRQFVVPGEAKVGWSWASYDVHHPYGLKKYKGSDDRKRPASILDRVL